MAGSLTRALSSFRRSWRKCRDDWNYGRARKVFGALFGYLRRRKSVPTAVQFDGLFRVLRYEGKCGTEAKLEVLRRGFPARVLDPLLPAIRKGCGCFGGALGAIERPLSGPLDRRRLFKMLEDVAEAADLNAADAAVSAYVPVAVKGLGVGIISSFLWSLKHDDYPIANEGAFPGMSAAIHGDRGRTEVGPGQSTT